MQAHQYNQLTEPSTYDQVDGKASTRIHLLLPKNSYKKDNVPEKRNTKAFVVERKPQDNICDPASN